MANGYRTTLEPDEPFQTQAGHVGLRRRRGMFPGPTMEREPVTERSIERQSAMNRAGASGSVRAGLLEASTRVEQRKKEERHSLLSPEGRKRHPVASAIVAGFTMGRQAPLYFQRQEEEERTRKDLAVQQARNLALTLGDESALHPEDPERENIGTALRAKRERATAMPAGFRPKRVTREGVTYEAPEEEATPPPGFKPKRFTKGGVTYEKPEEEEEPAVPPGFKPKSVRRKGVTYEAPEEPFEEPKITAAQMQAIIDRKSAEKRRIESQRVSAEANLKTLTKDPEENAEGIAKAQGFIRQYDDAIADLDSDIKAWSSRFSSRLPKGPLTREQFEALPPARQRDYLKEHRPPE